MPITPVLEPFVAGWAMHRGSTTDGLITVLSDSIRNRSSEFAAVNELCWSQYKAIQANLHAQMPMAGDTTEQ